MNDFDVKHAGQTIFHDTSQSRTCCQIQHKIVTLRNQKCTFAFALSLELNYTSLNLNAPNQSRNNLFVMLSWRKTTMLLNYNSASWNAPRQNQTGHGMLLSRDRRLNDWTNRWLTFKFEIWLQKRMRLRWCWTELEARYAAFARLVLM